MITKHEALQIMAWLVTIGLIIYGIATELVGVGTPPAP